MSVPSAEHPTNEPLPAPPRYHDQRLRPLGLGFVDRALERDWWAHHARERLTVMRTSVALLVVFAGLFAVVDMTVFRAHAPTLLTIRGAMIALLLVPSPLLYGRRALPLVARRGQELLLYLGVVATAPLLLMAALVLPGLGEVEVTVTLIAGLFVMLCIYCVSGLRFAYAAALGLAATVAYVVLLATRANASNATVVTAAAFLFGESLVGLLVSHTLETSARREFLRRAELADAQARADALLGTLLPEPVADRLKRGGGEPVERLPRATVLFATLVGFEEATAHLSALEAVRLLDRIVARFDRIARAHGVERIKTVGATYMAAAGVTRSQADDAVVAARLALALRDDVRALAAQLELPLALRAGLATGPLVAGVLGRTRLAFDCWGDTANVAARLDQLGLPDRIQLAPSTSALLAERGAFALSRRGRIAVKGKGDLETDWLDGAAAS